MNLSTQSQKETIIIIAPFAHIENCVGKLRTDRFIRWLSNANKTVIVIRAGATDQVLDKEYGLDIVISDPLNLYNNVLKFPRKPNKLIRFMASFLFTPDVGIVWARKVAKHKYINIYCRGVSKIISSNPPESVHCLGLALAKKLNTELIVDMRDGWLDESFKLTLPYLRLKCWYEGLLEKRILSQAKTIFVTSEVWKSLLNKRLSFTKDKTVVLTNACPRTYNHVADNHDTAIPDDSILLIYSGRFRYSYPGRYPSILLKCLFNANSDVSIKVNVLLVGSFSPEDMNEIQFWQNEFNKKGWSIITNNYIDRNDLAIFFDKAHGFLLLADSMANLPAKSFEYIVTKKPILAVGRKDSALESLAAELKQAYFCDYQNDVLSTINSQVTSFLQACKHPTMDNIEIPKQYCEEYLSSVFLRALNDIEAI